MISVRVLISTCLFALIIAGFTRPATAANYKFITLNPPDAINSYAYGINDSGQVVGYAQNSVGTDGFIYAGGKYVELSVDTPNAITQLFAINNNDEIVGEYTDQSRNQQPFTYNKGIYTYFNVFDGIYTIAYGINDAGSIVGGYSTGSRVDGFVGHDGVYTSFAFPIASDTWGTGINNFGQIVGYYQDSSDNNHGFLESNGRYYKIDVPGSVDTLAGGINDEGEIVGSYLDTSNPDNVQSFVGSNGNYTEIIPPNSYSSTAFGINDTGDIVGYYVDSNGAHGYLAIPVPETPTWSMILVGLIGISFASSRWNNNVVALIRP